MAVRDAHEGLSWTADPQFGFNACRAIITEACQPHLRQRVLAGLLACRSEAFFADVVDLVPKGENTFFLPTLDLSNPLLRAISLVWQEMHRSDIR